MAEYTEGGGEVLQGGYAQAIVVDKDFVLRIPPSLDLAAATPLLCAGITTFSPLNYFGVNETKKVAIVGLGGLGHMGVKFAVAMGAHTTVISRGDSKRESSLTDLKVCIGII
jgi:alcohol dehydrogenase (NADP+)